MTVDDETAKQLGTATGSTIMTGIIGFLGLRFLNIFSLPRRVERLESRAQASDRLLLALADTTLARAPKDKAEARNALLEARNKMYDSMTKTQSGKP
jgi:hypothetical protein